MTCKGPYCERSADCKDINCPGHPGQHCQHLNEPTPSKGPIHLSAGALYSILLIVVFASGVWFGYAITHVKEKPAVVRKTT